jgi:hypothetical protein
VSLSVRDLLAPGSLVGLVVAHFAPVKYLGLLGLVPLWMGLVKLAKLLYRLYKHRRNAAALTVMPADATEKGEAGVAANGTGPEGSGAESEDSDDDLDFAREVVGAKAREAHSHRSGGELEGEGEAGTIVVGSPASGDVVSGGSSL